MGALKSLVHTTMKIAILGSCRQASLQSFTQTTCLMEEITYPHYSKETLQLVKYCLYNDINQSDTLSVFRTAILEKSPILWKPHFRAELLESDIAVVEIASRRTYTYKNLYVHHILSEKLYNNGQEINQNLQGYDEILSDIIELIRLIQKPIVIASHLVTYCSGSRYELSSWLKEICKQLRIPYVNPIYELNKLGYSSEQVVEDEEYIAHLNELGHKKIVSIYKNALTNALRSWYL